MTTGVDTPLVEELCGSVVVVVVAGAVVVVVGVVVDAGARSTSSATTPPAGITVASGDTTIGVESITTVASGTTCTDGGGALSRSKISASVTESKLGNASC